MRLWVRQNNADFEGLTRQNLVPAVEGVAALMCVDPPTYDLYTQLLQFSMEWDFSWWVGSLLGCRGC